MKHADKAFLSLTRKGAAVMIGTAAGMRGTEKEKRIARAMMAMDAGFRNKEQDFNPYHAENGRFTSKGGQGSGGGAQWHAGEARVEVQGPKAMKAYTDAYIAKHPHVAETAKKLMHVRSMVMNFQKDHPNAEEGTYSATTGKPVENLSGFCVTFHQNLAADDPFGGYTDEEYADACAVAMDELGADDVNIGYFGNPEVSFSCADKQKAMDFAIRHNQHSIFDANEFKTLKNPYYRKTQNPIEGH